MVCLVYDLSQPLLEFPFVVQFPMDLDLTFQIHGFHRHRTHRHHHLLEFMVYLI